MNPAPSYKIKDFEGPMDLLLFLITKHKLNIYDIPIVELVEQYGDAQIDGGTGRQLAYKNIIIQSCESTPFDDNGYLWTDPRGSGSGWFITNGRAEKISWVKEGWSAEDPVETTIEAANLAVDVRECDFNVTRYYDADGNEITLNQGKTWVCIVRNSNADHVIISDDPAIDSYAIDF